MTECLCPDPWCPQHARCVWGHALMIEPDDPAFCPECGHDVMPVGACRRATPLAIARAIADNAAAETLAELRGES